MLLIEHISTFQEIDYTYRFLVKKFKSVMLQDFYYIRDNLLNHTIKIENKKLNTKICEYSFVCIPEDIGSEKDQEIIENLYNSEIIMINKNNDFKEEKSCDQNYFIIGLERIIIIIQQSFLNHLQPLLSIKRNIRICYLSKTKDYINNYIEHECDEILVDAKFNEEMFILNQNLQLKEPIIPSVRKMWQIIKPCISGYLIKQSLFKNTHK